MKKVAKKNILIERIHKGFVLGCIALTLYGLTGLGQRWYRYFTVLKPEAKQKELLEKQKLLEEGSSEILKDPAKNFAP